MTRLERALYRRRGLLFIVAALLFLGGAVGVAFIQIGHESDRADQNAANLSKANAEANARGAAVSTLAGDVRALRAQVKARGGTPVAPDPSSAVSNLPARTTVPVPVPIPGPTGATGPKGDTGAAASPVPGPSGSPGAQGSPGPAGATGVGVQGVQGVQGPQGDPGVAGQPGKDGTNGTDGRDGTNGAPPAGWTWSWTDQLGTVHTYTCSPADGFDPSAPRYSCTETTGTTPPTTAPSSSPASSRTGLLGIGMVASSASYRRL